MLGKVVVKGFDSDLSSILAFFCQLLTTTTQFFARKSVGLRRVGRCLLEVSE